MTTDNNLPLSDRLRLNALAAGGGFPPVVRAAQRAAIAHAAFMESLSPWVRDQAQRIAPMTPHPLAHIARAIEAAEEHPDRDAVLDKWLAHHGHASMALVIAAHDADHAVDTILGPGWQRLTDAELEALLERFPEDSDEWDAIETELYQRSITDSRHRQAMGLG